MPRPALLNTGSLITDYSLGIDLGGTSVKAVAVTPAGQTLAKSILEFNPGAKMDWAEKVRGVVQHLQREGGSTPHGIGLCAPGLAASDGRSIAHMPGRLQGLEGLNWTNFLSAKKPVPVLNDAHAALLGEAWLGAARRFQHVILLTLGTGVGGAAMVDGRLLRGRLGRAGHLGHICLDVDGPPDCARTPGSLEMAIGNCTIAARSRGRFRTTHGLVAAHRAGDAKATAIWLRSVRALACAIASFVNILDPQAVIIGGGIARSGAALFGPLRKFVREVEWQPGGQRVKLLPAKLDEFAGAFGAASIAMTNS
ncbi:MAG TPA: ROK family protein [Verrucomicrobiae bacterium]|jgi:glucokinase